MNRVRSLLSMRCLLLGYSFKPRPNIRALGTAGSVMTTRLTINGCSHSKNLFDEKTRFTHPEIWVSVTSKKLTWFKQSFLFSFSTKKAKKKLYSQVNQSKNNWCKQEQQILNSSYCKKQWRIQTVRWGGGVWSVIQILRWEGGGVPKKIFQPLGPQFDHFFKGNNSSRFFSRLIFISARIELLKCLSS